MHGLTGSSNTWLHKQSNTHWPRDLLPQTFADARVLQFVYDADVLRLWDPVSQSRIGNHAENMLGALARLRERTYSEDRKIIFVVHSLGGLVTQAALSLSRQSPEEHIRKVGECIHGIVFLGTPHFGADLAKWAEFGTRTMNMVQNPNVDIVAVLKPSSEVLTIIQKDFHGILRMRREEKAKIYIICFYEELPPKVPGVGLVVPMHSAILPGYSSYGIHANHQDMTKFGSRDETSYQDICGELLRWIKPLRAK